MPKVSAYAAMAPGSPLEPYTFELQTPGRKEVEIAVTHCGICHSDIHMINDDWGFGQYPLVPGHEAIGTVTALGEGVTHLAIGQRVGVGWQAGACLECEWCESGWENLCKDNKATIGGRPGGFAEKLVVDSRFAFPIPDGLSSETAGPLLCGGITVYSPYRNYNVLPHHKVGIIGIGGLGHLAIQFGAAMGCEVTAFSSTPAKEAEAKAHGARHFINSRDPEALELAKESLDFIISTVNVDLDWQAYVKILRPNGKLCFVGASSASLDIPPGMLLMGQKAVGGSVIGGRARMREMLEFAARHGVKAQAEVVPVAQVNDAIQKVRDNQARYRMVLKF